MNIFEMRKVAVFYDWGDRDAPCPSGDARSLTRNFVARAATIGPRRLKVFSKFL